MRFFPYPPPRPFNIWFTNSVTLPEAVAAFSLAGAVQPQPCWKAATFMPETKSRKISLGFTQEEFPAGTHMCYIYNDDRERHDTMLKYIECGLSEGEEVHYFYHPGKGETLEAAQERIGMRNLAAGWQGVFKLAQALDVYCPDRTFIVELMLGRLRDTYLASVEHGFPGVRVSGEMGWALEGLPGTERLIEYEARVNTVVAEYPCTACCQYDARRFDGATLFHVLSVHPAMVVHGQVVRNPYYIPPEKFLAKLRDEA